MVAVANKSQDGCVAVGSLVQICGIQDELTANVLSSEGSLRTCRLQPDGLCGLVTAATSSSKGGPCFLVETFTGMLVEVPAENAQQYHPADVQEGGFDAAWPLGRDDATREKLEEEFASAVVRTLAAKNFCVVRIPQSEDQRQAALDAAEALGSWNFLQAEEERFRHEADSSRSSPGRHSSQANDGSSAAVGSQLHPGREASRPDERCVPMTEETMAAYLGRNNTTKFAYLPADTPDAEPKDALSACDRVITDFCLKVESLTQEQLGFRSWGRLSGWVRMPLGAKDEPLLQQQGETSFDSKRIAGHLNFIDRRKLLVLYVVDAAGGGDLVLRPLKDTDLPWEQVRLPLSSGTLVVFRCDQMGYSYRPEGSGLLLQSWLLSEPFMPDPRESNVVAMPMELAKESVAVASMAIKLPGKVSSPDAWWNCTLAGTDSLTKIPLVRWDVDAYYCPDKSMCSQGQTYAKHGAFHSDEVAQLFDANFFGISDDEALKMSPSQRMILESGFECMWRAGYTRESCQGEKCGVYCGNSGTDWNTMLFAAAAGEATEARYAGQSNNMLSTRVSHVLGLQGPAATVDTACSSSLIAMSLAHNACRSRTPKDHSMARIAVGVQQLRNALVVGEGLLLGPDKYVLYCGPGMLSPRGRCFTFDSNADGYARGEGCGSTLLRVLDDTRPKRQEEVQSMHADLAGSAINQDGRSASMTAPNGPSQQEAIRASMRENRIEPWKVNVAECHGTGTALGDPIEVSALSAVMQQHRDKPLLTCSAKTNIGHLEAAAGMAGFVKCVQLLNTSCGAPNVHLNSMNPHMGIRKTDQIQFETELVDTGINNGFTGVSSFGFGGTNGRCDLWGRCTRGFRKVDEVDTGDRARNRRQMYHRVLRYGTPGPQESDKVQICGSWSGFRGEEMFDIGKPMNAAAFHAKPRHPNRDSKDARVSHKEYRARVILGETRMEQFRLTINGSNEWAVHPDCGLAGSGAPARGPDAEGAGKSWLIDGNMDEVPRGATYIVSFVWGFDWERGEYKKVTWEVDHSAAHAGKQVAAGVHFYSIVGTWTAGQLREMSRSDTDVGVWHETFRIGLTGQEEFQIVRDNDRAQVIHPAVEKARKTNVPVIGPDNRGEGKKWLIAGPMGETVHVRLRVVDGKISVSVTSETKGERTWRSEEADGWCSYFLTSDGKDFTEVLPSAKASGLYKCRVTLGSLGRREFQVWLNKDSSLRLYPHSEAGKVANKVLCRLYPGHLGDSFSIVGTPGRAYDVVINFVTGDHHRLISWHEVA